jgi:hypothetical protein
LHLSPCSWLPLCCWLLLLLLLLPELNDRRGEWSWREDDDLGAGGGEVLQD